MNRTFISRHQKILIGLFILIFLSLSSQALSQEQQTNDIKPVNNERLINIQHHIQKNLKKYPVTINHALWAKVVNAYADDSLDIPATIKKQMMVFKKIEKIYDPDVLPALSVIMTLIENLYQKNQEWIKQGNPSLLSKKQSTFLKFNFSKYLEMRKIKLGTIQTSLFTLAAVQNLGEQQNILLHYSFIKNPLYVDKLVFSRIFYHELSHFFSKVEISSPKEELEAELFSIKCMFLLIGKEQTRQIYQKLIMFTEQKKLLDELSQNIDNPKLVSAIYYAIIEHAKKTHHDFESKMISIAETELYNASSNDQKRSKLLLALTNIHIETLLLNYALFSSVFYHNMNKLIADKELPVDYLEIYSHYINNPRIIKAILHESGPLIQAKTIEFYTKIFLTMLCLNDMADKLNKEEFYKKVEKDILEYAFNVYTMTHLLNGQINLLAFPMEFYIVYPAQMRAFLEAKDPFFQRKEPDSYKLNVQDSINVEDFQF